MQDRGYKIMFRIITGKPGSGKSFYAVNYVKRYTRYDKLYNTMHMDHDVLLVTNIDNISVPHMHTNEFYEKNLLNIDNIREYLKQNNYKRCPGRCSCRGSNLCILQKKVKKTTI